MITNSLSDFANFKNPKWRILFGGKKILMLYPEENLIKENFGALIMKLLPNFENYENLKWQTQYDSWK